MEKKADNILLSRDIVARKFRSLTMLKFSLDFACLTGRHVNLRVLSTHFPSRVDERMELKKPFVATRFISGLIDRFSSEQFFVK